MHQFRLISLSLVFMFGFTVSATSADQTLPNQSWSQWRGPQRDGTLPGTALPDSLNEQNLKLRWELPLSPGYSGPIVTADRVFVTETVKEETEVVRALDRQTGKELWKQSWPGAISVPFFAKANGDWIRATPAFDGERLYVAGIRDVLVCLDAASGSILWRLDFVEQLKSSLPSFGFASSPLVTDEAVYVQAGGGFCKVNKLTGEVIWRVLEDGGGMFGSAFSSPCLAELDGVQQILVQTRTTLAGVDPESGQVFWEQKIPAFRGMNILTPAVVNNTVFTSSYGGRSFLFEITRNDGKWQVKELWSNAIQGYMSSPIILNGYIYLHLKNQRFTCLDLKTGKAVWTTAPYGKYWSMVTDGQKILALDQKGELLLIKASPTKFELLDQRKVAEDSWAYLAVSGKDLFIRDLKQLSVYQAEQASLKN